MKSAHDINQAYHLFGVCRFKFQGNLSAQLMKFAQVQLIQKYPLLNTYIDCDNEGVLALFAYQEKQVHEMRIAEKQENAVQQYLDELVNIKMNDQKLWQLNIIHTTLDHYYLIFVGHHTIVDGLSVAKICQQFIYFLHHPECIQEEMQAPILNSVEHLFPQKTSLIRFYGFLMWDKFVERLRRQSSQRRLLPKINSNNDQQKTLASQFIFFQQEDSELNRLLQVCHEHHITLTDLLYGCLVKTIFLHQAITQETMIAGTVPMKSNQEKKCVGSFVEPLPINISINPQESILTIAKKFHVAFRKKIMAGPIFPYNFTPGSKLQRKMHNALEKSSKHLRFDCRLSNIGVLENELMHKMLMDDFYFFNTHTNPEAMVSLYVATLNNKLCFTLVYTMPSLKEDEVEIIKKIFIAQLKTVACSP